jgi:ribulose-phosphate 3-epimerase
MTEVIPAILVKNFEELREQISKVVSIVRVVQIDVCDGDFVPTTSWPINEFANLNIEKILAEEEGLPYWDSLDFEFDLMVRNAHTQFELWMRLGAHRIVFHLEAERDRVKFKEFLESIDMYTRENVDIGVAIDTTTSVDELKNIIPYVDFVQCMGIEHDGKQGQPFDNRVIDHIKSLRLAYPEIIISVDGSVNEITAPLLVEAGANRLVVGSALMTSYDVRETIKYFESL